MTGAWARDREIGTSDLPSGIRWVLRVPIALLGGLCGAAVGTAMGSCIGRGTVCEFPFGFPTWVVADTLYMDAPWYVPLCECVAFAFAARQCVSKLVPGAGRYWNRRNWHVYDNLATELPRACLVVAASLVALVAALGALALSARALWHGRGLIADHYLPLLLGTVLDLALWPMGALLDLALRLLPGSGYVRAVAFRWWAQALGVEGSAAAQCAATGPRAWWQQLLTDGTGCGPDGPHRARNAYSLPRQVLGLLACLVCYCCMIDSPIWPAARSRCTAAHRWCTDDAPRRVRAYWQAARQRARACHDEATVAKARLTYVGAPPAETVQPEPEAMVDQAFECIHPTAQRSFERVLNDSLSCLNVDRSYRHRSLESLRPRAQSAVRRCLEVLCTAFEQLGELLTKHPKLCTEGNRAKLRAIPTAVMAARPELWTRECARHYGLVLRTMHPIASLLCGLRNAAEVCARDDAAQRMPFKVRISAADDVDGARMRDGEVQLARERMLELMSGGGDGDANADDDDY